MLKVKLVDERFPCTDPGTGKALTKGKEVQVEDSTYWRERVREGVLTLVHDGTAEANEKSLAETADANAEAKAKAEAEAKAKAKSGN